MPTTPVYVPNTTTVNGHALSGNVVVSASDLTTGTLPHAQLPTLLSGDIPNNSSNTTGTAANVTTTSNSTLVTLSALSLPYSQVTSTPVLPSNTSGVSHKYITAYNSTTGAFTQAQPSSADLSDLGSPNGAAQLNASGDIPVAALGTGSNVAGSYVDGAAGAWTALPFKTLTTTGSSGAATLSSGTLNIPNYTYTLPNPTTSSLGGIQAVNAVSHKWVASINTSGVPQLTQPASTDLSDVSGLTTVNGLVKANGSGAFTTAVANTDYVTPAGQYITSLTTTGTSGAATVVGGTLNIPVYAGGGSMTYPSGSGVAIVASGTSWGTTLPVAGSGAGVVTGPTTSVSGDIATFTGTTGQITDSGTLLSSLVKDGSGVTTAGYIPVSTTTAHTLSYTPTSTYNLSVPALSASDTVATLGVAQTFTKTNTYTVTAAASTYTTNFSSAPYTAGSATTNFPTVAIGNTGSAVTTWATTGTFLGIQPASGFTGNAIDVHAVNGGASVFAVNYLGGVTCSTMSSSGKITSTANNGCFRSSGVQNGASSYMIEVDTAPYASGTGTTTFPVVAFIPGATAVTTWSTSGTFIGVNAASGFGGNFLDFHTNNSASLFAVSSTGGVSCASLPTQIHAFSIIDMSNSAYTASQVVGYWQAPMAGTIPTGGSATNLGVTGTLQASLQTGVNASTTFTLAYATSITGTFTNFGTIVFSTSGQQTSPTVTISSSQSVALGGVIRVSAPASPDSLAAGLILSVPYVY